MGMVASCLALLLNTDIVIHVPIRPPAANQPLSSVGIILSTVS